MFKYCKILTTVLLSFLFVIQITDADYTSEETDEKSKSLFSAVTSILGSTESSKHHHKHSFNSPPCASGGCPLTGPIYGGNNAAVSVGYGASGRNIASVSPCRSPTGCPNAYGTAGYAANSGVSSVSGGASTFPAPTSTFGYAPQQQAPSGAYGSASFHSSAPPVTPQNAAGAYGNSGSYGSLPTAPYQGPVGAYGPVPPAPYQGQAGAYGSVPTGPHPPPSGAYGSAGYTQPGAAAPPYGHYGYQGPRGYSVLDHSLKSKSEYTEVGTHNGPLQQANNGFGYGSGYGGYNGLYNRPGF